MEGWLTAHHDLSHQAGGLMLLVLGIVILLLPRRAVGMRFAVEMRLLAAFALLLGLREFVGLAALHRPGSWLRWLEAILVLGACLVLLEFGRRAVEGRADSNGPRAGDAGPRAAQRSATATLSHVAESLRIKDAAIESSLNAVALAGLDGRLFYVNRAFVDLWRLQRPEDALGRLATEFWEEPAAAQRAMDSLHVQGHWQGELRAQRHDGSLADLQLSAHLVRDGDGRPACMMGSFVDVTVRKQAEQALQAERDFAASLIDTAPVIVLLLDPAGTIRHVNPCFEKLTGYRLAEIRGKDWFATFLPAEERDGIRSLFLTALGDVPTRGNVNAIVTRSGELRQIEWNDQVMRDAQGRVTGIIAIGLDVTERAGLASRRPT